MIPIQHLGLPALFVVLGALVGYTELAGLRRNVESYLRHGLSVRTVGLHALRVLLVAGALVAVVPFGAAALLAVLVGLLLARTWLLWGARRQA